jgi:hypothetical protein
MPAFSITEPQLKPKGTRINVWEGHSLPYPIGSAGIRRSHE